MYVMMPVNVISKECSSCPRLRISVIDEHAGGKVSDREMECVHYDDCLATVDIYKRGQLDPEDYSNPINGVLMDVPEIRTKKGRG